MSAADAIRRLTAPFERRLRAMCTRVIVQLVDDDQGLQLLQLSGLAGERLSKVQRLQNFGFSGHAPAGSTGVMLCVGGSRSHPVVIAIDNGEFRPKGLEPGASAQYDMSGNFILIKGDEIHVKHSAKVTIDAPLAHFTGNVTVDGTIAAVGNISSQANVSDFGGSLHTLRTTYNGHTHPGDSGGNTGTPSATA